MDRVFSWQHLVPLFAWCALAACSERPSRMPGLVTDSAGVMVVENVAPAWALDEGWSIDPTPILDLTTRGTGEAYEFFRVSDVTRFSDGRVVVADGGLGTIRVFDASGELMQQFGRKGEGPAEFQRLAQVWAIDPDTVVAFDAAGRISWFLDSGDLQRDVRLEPQGVSPWAQLARFSDGDFVGTVGWSSAQFPPTAQGLMRLDAPVLLLEQQTAAVDTLVSLPGAEVFQLGDLQRRFVGVPPLGKYLIVRAYGTDVFAGAGDGLSYDRWDRSGALLQRVRVRDFDLSGAEQVVDEFMTAQLATIEDAETRRMLGETFGEIPIPDERPGYSDLRLDPDGNLWAAEHRGQLHLVQPTSWQVFSLEGRWLGSVQTPKRFRVLRIGRDWIAGYYLDDFDVHHVRLHTIEKPE